ncbi:hypothetical protein CPPEL_04920 [Corynebacterium pseudopelargi]|uniref:Uncharacterized protein n=1 Tax=Corynebacterium pseudopelargi TaxID=2080757 RepID=A0A3G6ITP4_9CORY|nr:hypothetical protein CPPEL_04920 [Corynebacterium pseudopelargi]
MFYRTCLMRQEILNKGLHLFGCRPLLLRLVKPLKALVQAPQENGTEVHIGFGGLVLLCF